jgi:transposase
MRMSHLQWRKLDILDRIGRGELTLAEGAKLVGLSRRQLQRLRQKVRVNGPKAVVHGNTGRAPAHKTAELVRRRVVELARGKYAGFNDEHFTEKLYSEEGLDLARQTVRRILRAAGIASPRKRRAVTHRRRRDRFPQAGQMILWDGSRHDWLEGRGPRLCLTGAIDDATGELLPGAHFVDQECSLGYLRVLLEIVAAKGIPMSAYMDRHGILKRNDQHWTLPEQLAGRQEPTQVRRALDDLGIQTIYALSPQAKGRVERLWGTLQDRLVSELRLAKVSDAASANAFLVKYRLEHNARFAVTAVNSNPAWQPVPEGLDPEEVCCFQYVRMVKGNNTVRIGKQVIDIPARAGRASFSRATVLVRHLLRGEYRVLYQGKCVASAQAPVPTEPAQEARTEPAWKEQKARAKRRMGETESLAG